MTIIAGLENLGILKQAFRFLAFLVFQFLRFVLDFSVQRRLDTKLRPTKNILYIILPVTSFSMNYSRMHYKITAQYYSNL